MFVDDVKIHESIKKLIERSNTISIKWIKFWENKKISKKAQLLQIVQYFRGQSGVKLFVILSQECGIRNISI